MFRVSRHWCNHQLFTNRNPKQTTSRYKRWRVRSSLGANILVTTTVANESWSESILRSKAQSAEICDSSYILAKWANCEVKVGVKFSTDFSRRWPHHRHQAPPATLLLFHTNDYIKICYLIPIDMVCDQAKSITKNKLRQPLESKDQDNVFQVSILVVWVNQL